MDMGDTRRCTNQRVIQIHMVTWCCKDTGKALLPRSEGAENKMENLPQGTLPGGGLMKWIPRWERAGTGREPRRQTPPQEAQPWLGLRKMGGDRCRLVGQGKQVAHRPGGGGGFHGPLAHVIANGSAQT